MTSIRVVIADDQPVVREGLSTILAAMPDVDVVGVATDGAEAVDLAERTAADVVLMDLQMPYVDGIEATRLLAARRPGTTVIVLTTYTDDESILHALAAGAAGYLTKNAAAEDIERALHASRAGHTVLDDRVRARLVEFATRPEAGPYYLPDGLSTREGEVLALIAEGLSNSEIAERLFIGHTTVKTHVNQILRKTRSRDRPQAIVYALNHDITVANVSALEAAADTDAGRPGVPGPPPPSASPGGGAGTQNPPPVRPAG